MLIICNNTEIPPIPSRKEASIIFIDMFFIWILDIRERPFVISKIPIINGSIKEAGICIVLNNGISSMFIIYITWLSFNIEIITENITIKPPIIKIVDVALEIEFAINSPKFTKEAVLEDEFDIILRFFVFVGVYQNLNKIPTVIDDNICVMRSKIPIVVLPNILIPIVPTMKRGPRIICKT